MGLINTAGRLFPASDTFGSRHKCCPGVSRPAPPQTIHECSRKGGLSSRRRPARVATPQASSLSSHLKCPQTADASASRAPPLGAAFVATGATARKAHPSSRKSGLRADHRSVLLPDDNLVEVDLVVAACIAYEAFPRRHPGLILPLPNSGSKRRPAGAELRPEHSLACLGTVRAHASRSWGTRMSGKGTTITSFTNGQW